jgi:hypothetical protein
MKATALAGMLKIKVSLCGRPAMGPALQWDGEYSMMVPLTITAKGLKCPSGIVKTVIEAFRDIARCLEAGATQTRDESGVLHEKGRVVASWRHYAPNGDS